MELTINQPRENYFSQALAGLKRMATTIFTGISFLLGFVTLLAYLFIDFSEDGFAFLHNVHTAGFYQTDIILGVDGLSIVFMILTGFIFPSCFVLARSLQDNSKASLHLLFLIFVLLMEVVLLGIFLLLDLFLFYVCFEAILIPMFMLIGT